METAPARGALVDAIRERLDAGDADAAIALCQSRIRESSQDADAHRHLGQLCAARGDHLPALRAALRACELAPDDPRAWSDLGRVHALAGEYAHAARCFTEAVEADVRHADAWHNLGIALRRLHQPAQAFEALRNALSIEPTRADTYLVLGTLFIDSGQLEDAIRCFERAAANDPTMPRARSRLAEQWSARGKVRRAEALFRQSLGMDPDHVEGWVGLGLALEDLGDAEGARGAYLNALRRRPGQAHALGRYVALLRSTEPAEEERRWVQLAEAGLQDASVPDEARALVGYGLARFHDSRGDWARAAASGRLANAARRRIAGPLDRDALKRRVDETIALATREFFEARRRHGLGSDQPVFIVGMPRSGTTLSEQILAAHPQAHGAGELPDLARLASLAASDEGVAPWQAVAHIDPERSRALAGAYLRALREGAPVTALRVSDKSPLNAFQLALAAVMLPNARVIHVRRAAPDVALSIWMENFNAEQRYATDFGDLRCFIDEVERLMAHWRLVLPLPILEIRYEDMVADLEGQARRMLSFLGLPWDRRCLDFHRGERAIQTPSRWQVRQPLYAGSVGRWRRYADWLPEIAAQFPRQEDGP